VLGGGTALMIHAGHRISKDIDAFIEDPQHLPFLSPRLAGEGVWGCEAYEESANHLKLIFPEGEIDFIVASRLTNLATELKTIDVGGFGTTASHKINVEHPVEIAIKKLLYRGAMLKVRDIFDIAVVDALFPDLLRANLDRVAHLKPAIIARLDGVSEDYLHLEISELDIAEKWRTEAVLCRNRVSAIIAAIPD
jgi:hypothetical protein